MKLRRGMNLYRYEKLQLLAGFLLQDKMYCKTDKEDTIQVLLKKTASTWKMHNNQFLAFLNCFLRDGYAFLYAFRADFGTKNVMSDKGVHPKTACVR